MRDRALVGTLINAFSAAIGNTLTVDNIGLQIDDPAPLLTLARQGAFEACSYAIERLKAIAPIWKKEVGPDGTYWVEGPRGG